MSLPKHHISHSLITPISSPFKHVPDLDSTTFEIKLKPFNSSLSTIDSLMISPRKSCFGNEEEDELYCWEFCEEGYCKLGDECEWMH